jgi:multiple sugar transport system ATP-binding protein
MATLELAAVEKSFGTTRVIHGVDLAIGDGEFVVFVGPSGCGKSTLLRLICGLDPVTGGEIRIDGARVNEVAAADRGLAMVFQSYALYPHMTVRDNLAFGLENVGTPKAEIEQKVRTAAAMLRLDELLARRPTQLSGGQRQRVAIGRAIVREPRIFLFDEPLSNLDAELRVSMRTEIIALHQRLRTTMIYVTHDQVEAMTMANRIVVLRAGRVEQVGAPLELYNAPRNRFVAGFIGSPQMNFLPVRLAASEPAGLTIDLSGGRSARLPFAAAGLAPGSPLTLGIRPEHLAVGEAALAFDLAVEQVEQLGGHCLLHGHVGGTDERLTLAAPGQTTVRVGDTVPVGGGLEHCHLFGEDGLALPRLEGARP